MRHLKKIISCVLTTAAVFALTGCGQKEQAGQETNTQTTEVQTSESGGAESQESGSDEAPKSGQDDNGSEERQVLPAGGSGLVIYFSATGNTENVAGYIAKTLGADTYEIVPEEPYTSNDLNWTDDSSRASQEHENPDFRPAIGGDLIDLTSYDTIFLGFPLWWGEAPNIVRTLMESVDFNGTRWFLSVLHPPAL